MEQNEPERLIKVKVSDLLKKFRHKEDRYNFCRQKGNLNLLIFIYIVTMIGYWLPNEVGFDATFFVQFLCKKKEVKIKYY